MSLFYEMWRRGFDVISTVSALILLSPLLLLIAIFVKISSRGPVFFRQIRIGLAGRRFRLIKFRSMIKEADRLGPGVTATGDERITLVGKFLRRFKLDELPQLLNVIRGDLTLVGPRPEVPEYVQENREDWRRVLTAKPGITDFASLQFRDEESVLKEAHDREKAYLEVVQPIKIKLALEYIEKRSIGVDLKILFQTVWGITLGRFIYKPGNELALTAKQEILRMNKTEVE